MLRDGGEPERSTGTVDDLQFPGSNIDDQPMNRELWQIGAGTDHLHGLLDADVYIAKGADPAYQSLNAAQALLRNQSFGVDAQRLHRTSQGRSLNVRETALRVANNQNPADTK